MLPAVPLVIVMSPTTNPETLSLNVMVTGIGDVPVGLVAVVEMMTVGAILSNVLDSTLEAVFPLVAASAAAFAGMLTVTEPAAAGVMLTV